MKNIWTLVAMLFVCAGARSQDTSTNSYTLTNLVTNQTDPHLVNPWGLSRTASSYWWAADEGSGVSTLYDGSGNIQTLVVTVPPASGTGKGTPTGTVAIGSAFVFVTLDGTI